MGRNSLYHFQVSALIWELFTFCPPHLESLVNKSYVRYSLGIYIFYVVYRSNPFTVSFCPHIVSRFRQLFILYTPISILTYSLPSITLVLVAAKIRAVLYTYLTLIQFPPLPLHHPYLLCCAFSVEVFEFPFQPAPHSMGAYFPTHIHHFLMW